ncbi:MAG: threonine--tRNA ligase [Candidatus Hodarchaeota archaeon]
MRLLFVHSETFRYMVRQKALKSAEDIDEKEFSFPDSCLVAFSAVETNDEANPQRIVEKACEAVTESAKELKEQNIILYPWVHLSTQPASPGIALQILKGMTDLLRNKGLKISRAPFGYYKAFDLHCKGHPLAERSKQISLEKDETIEPAKVKIESFAAIEAEEKTKKQYYILDPQGNLTLSEEFNFKQNPSLKVFVQHEIKKDRVAKKDPPHTAIMRRLELVDHEPGSDAGNFRFPPKGYVVKRLLEDYVQNKLIDYGAMIVETPLMYSYTHPHLKSYLERFPSRQYVVQSGQNNYFLRFAACFGQFLLKSASNISYRSLPLKMAEIALSFRREQHGEISGLRRLRTFTMPDLHTVTADFDQAKQAFKEQFQLSMEIMQGLELEYETAFRVQTEIFEKNKDWILEMVRELNKPILIELFDERYAYFILKFEFNFNDSQKKSAALSTVQIDVENAERFDISYMDNEGELQRPLLLHCSISGSIERCIYALLEKAYLDQQKGLVPELPLWLAPSQVRLIPVNENFLPLTEKLAAILEPEVRVEIDDRDMTVGRKVRAAEKLWTPLIVVLGEKEADLTKLNVRIRKEKIEKSMSPDELKTYVIQTCIEKPKMKLPLSKYVSKQPVFSRGV